MSVTGPRRWTGTDAWSRLPRALVEGAEFFPARLDLFAFPPHAPEPAAWIQHVPFARWLVDELEPKTFAELGTEHGLSYFAVCDAVCQLGLPTTCYAVDHWKGDAHTGLYGEEVYEAVAARNVEFQSFSSLVRESFDEAASHFPDSSLDVLHIDGHHTYESARADFDNWIGKVREGGVILLHDTNVRKLDYGVFRLMEELREVWPCLEFPFGNGLGVVCKGEADSSSLHALATGPEERRCRFVAVMGWLGASMQMAYDAGKMHTALRELVSLRHELDSVRQSAAHDERAMRFALNELRTSSDAHVGLLERRVQVALVDLEDRTRACEDMQNSMSWRLTRPLRFGKRVATLRP